jgi:hypothetical protein
MHTAPGVVESGRAGGGGGAGAAERGRPRVGVLHAREVYTTDTSLHTSTQYIPYDYS